MSLAAVSFAARSRRPPHLSLSFGLGDALADLSAYAQQVVSAIQSALSQYGPAIVSVTKPGTVVMSFTDATALADQAKVDDIQAKATAAGATDFTTIDVPNQPSQAQFTVPSSAPASKGAAGSTSSNWGWWGAGGVAAVGLGVAAAKMRKKR